MSVLTIYFPEEKKYCTISQYSKALKFLGFPDVIVTYPSGRYRGRIIGQSGIFMVHPSRL
jgi:hypothetical protein